MCQVWSNGRGSNHNDPGKERSLCLTQGGQVTNISISARVTIIIIIGISMRVTIIIIIGISMITIIIIVIIARTADTDVPLLGPNQG